MPSAPRKVRRVAMTGGIASGKSLAGAFLKSKGIPVIDADDVVHALLREDEDLKRRIREAFGDAVFDADGAVNRPALGRIVFNDVAKRKLLESWIHPKTRDVIERFYQQHADALIVVSIIPLLFESGLQDRYDEVWLLETDEAQQVERLMQNRGMSREDAEARIRNQMPLAEKREKTRAHAAWQILDNRGTPEHLQNQLERVLSQMRDFSR
ncbi:MAG TPA: dephospho-CoA kinase [Oculatellaceae cyanobacterium]|jgi:dephospho-CoA kinase